jgi:hypothetical protein
MVKGKGVPGRIPFVAVRSVVLRPHAARDNDASYGPAVVQLPSPAMVVGLREELEHLLPGTSEYEIVRSNRNTIAAWTQTSLVENENMVEAIAPDRADQPLDISILPG